MPKLSSSSSFLRQRQCFQRVTMIGVVCAMLLQMAYYFESWGDGLLSRNSDRGLYFGMVFDASFIHNNITTSTTETTTATNRNTTEAPPAPSSSSSSLSSQPCQVMISNRVGNFHYEVLESVALQFPIDWGRSSNNNDDDDAGGGCRTAGWDRSTPIAVDFYLDFKYKKGGYANNTSEAWGWNDYFEKHLQGTVVQRHARFRPQNEVYPNRGNVSYNEDRRWIQFRSVVDVNATTSTHSSIGDHGGGAKYDVNIETNCGFIGNWELRLKRNRKTDYCVLHSAHPKKVRELQLGPQICNLNPQHAPRCWFLPSDLPKFQPPTLPNKKQGRPIRICIGWKADNRGEHRDTSLLVQALETLRPENVQLVVIGRNAKIPQRIQAGTNISHFVALESSHSAFYDYQFTISRCHVLVPLIHPSGASAAYFLGPGGKGKLSGMISQAIGNGIPALVHSAVADIYRDLFTAPIFEYNETSHNSSSFIRAFQQSIDFYHYKTEKDQAT